MVRDILVYLISMNPSKLLCKFIISGKPIQKCKKKKKKKKNAILRCVMFHMPEINSVKQGKGHMTNFTYFYIMIAWLQALSLALTGHFVGPFTHLPITHKTAINAECP